MRFEIFEKRIIVLRIITEVHHALMGKSTKDILFLFLLLFLSPHPTATTFIP
jgi:hypothetical protein